MWEGLLSAPTADETSLPEPSPESTQRHTSNILYYKVAASEESSFK